MSFKKLKEFIDLAKAEGVAELKYEGKDEKFAVSFLSSSAAPVAIERTAPVVQRQEGSPKLAAQSSNDGFHEITSPFVGTFYAQSSPSDPAYVKLGDRVSKGQVLCILEAMKIMNEIEADINGEIVEICVENESLVEFGQTLFKVKV